MTKRILEKIELSDRISDNEKEEMKKFVSIVDFFDKKQSDFSNEFIYSARNAESMIMNSDAECFLDSVMMEFLDNKIGLVINIFEFDINEPEKIHRVYSGKILNDYDRVIENLKYEMDSENLKKLESFLSDYARLKENEFIIYQIGDKILLLEKNNVQEVFKILNEFNKIEFVICEYMDKVIEKIKFNIEILRY